MRKIGEDFTALKADDRGWRDKGGKVHMIKMMNKNHIIATYRLLQYQKKVYEMIGKTIIIPNLLIERYHKIKEKYPELLL